MAISDTFQLPEEVLLSPLFDNFPGRELQIRALSALLSPNAAPCRNLVLYGAEATGKTTVTKAVLGSLAARTISPAPEAEPQLKHAIVNSTECITGRHLFEATIGAVLEALGIDEARRKCENLAQLAVELGRRLRDTSSRDYSRFVLVFDAIDRQRDAPPTLLPALARLSEMIPSLTTVFIVTSPASLHLRTTAVPHIYFPNYTKAEAVKILANGPPANLPTTTVDETRELWTRFCGAVYDSLIKTAARSLPAFKHTCAALWPRFTAPILAGTHGPKEFSKLLIAGRVHFQDESLLNPSIISVRLLAVTSSSGNITKPNGIANTMATASRLKPESTAPDLSTLLPTTARLLLLAAYLASHNAPRHDLTLFSTYHHGKRKRRGGGFAMPGGGRGRPRSKHRKIARKLLGAHAFILERMMAIFAAVRSEWVVEVGRRGEGAVLDGDVAMAISTLASLRLLIRVGASADPLDRGGKWRINVGWEIVRGVGRSIGVEVEEWLID